MKKWKHVMSLLVAGLLSFSGCTRNGTNEINPADRLNKDNQRDIYFATGNDYYDLYIGHSQVPGPEIELLSRNYIDPESIQVTLDIQAQYTVYVAQQETGKSLSSYEITEEDGVRHIQTTAVNAYDFPLYLYQTYAGIDWAEVGRLHISLLSALDAYKNGEIDESQYNTASALYRNAVTEYATDYMKLAAEDLPTFYKYLIQITIDDAQKEETLRTVQVTIGESTYDVDIGQVNIRPNPGYGDGDEYLIMTAGSPYWISCYPYGEGIENCHSSTYYADRTVTLTGLRFRENTLSTAEILDVTVVISENALGAFDGSGISIQWDGKTPILVEQGKYVAMIITFQDARMTQINYHSKLYPILELEYDGQDYEVFSEIPLIRKYTDTWLQYAIGLDGLDMESYFNDYYYASVSTWRKDIDREAWENQ